MSLSLLPCHNKTVSKIKFAPSDVLIQTSSVKLPANSFSFFPEPCRYTMTACPKQQYDSVRVQSTLLNWNIPIHSSHWFMFNFPLSCLINHCQTTSTQPYQSIKLTFSFTLSLLLQVCWFTSYIWICQKWLTILARTCNLYIGACEHVHFYMHTLSSTGNMGSLLYIKKNGEYWVEAFLLVR